MTDKYTPPPITQGQIKTRRRLKELFDNEIFKSELEEILSIKGKTRKNKELRKLAEKYFLEYEMGSPLVDLVIGLDPGFDKQIGHELDVCQIYDEEDEYLNENFRAEFDNPLSRLPRIRARIHAYPIHIGINVHASKRDVLDFINKRWDYIQYLLEGYLNGKPKIVKKRPKAKRDQLIWDNRDKPAKTIANIVNKKFPKENLTYSDVNSILYYLRTRKFSEQV